MEITEKKLNELMDEAFYLGLNNCWEKRYKEIKEKEIKKLK